MARTHRLTRPIARSIDQKMIKKLPVADGSTKPTNEATKGTNIVQVVDRSYLRIQYLTSVDYHGGLCEDRVSQ